MMMRPIIAMALLVVVLGGCENRHAARKELKRLEARAGAHRAIYKAARARAQEQINAGNAKKYLGELERTIMRERQELP